MKKVIRFIDYWNEDDVRFFASLGIKVIPNESSNIYVKEKHIQDSIHQYLLESDNHPLCIEDYSFEYTKEEILASEYCVIRNYHYCGYPEHLNDITCEWQDNCTSCHYNAVQIDDYRVSKVAKHKLWGFFAWVFEVLFASVDLYQEVFEPLGIGCRPLRTKGGKIIDGVVQLVIPVIDEDMVFLNHNYRECPECGKRKYVGAPINPFYPLHKHPLPHIYLSKERFGDGWFSDREIYISTELALKLIKMKELKYEWLIPCKPNYEAYLTSIDGWEPQQSKRLDTGKELSIFV